MLEYLYELIYSCVTYKRWWVFWVIWWHFFMDSYFPDVINENIRPSWFGSHSLLYSSTMATTSPHFPAEYTWPPSTAIASASLRCRQKAGVTVTPAWTNVREMGSEARYLTLPWSCWCSRQRCCHPGIRSWCSSDHPRSWRSTCHIYFSRHDPRCTTWSHETCCWCWTLGSRYSDQLAWQIGGQTWDLRSVFILDIIVQQCYLW